MVAYEWLACGYFAALSASAVVGALSGRATTGAAWDGLRQRHLAVACAAAAVSALIVVAAHSTTGWVRAWLPHLYLVIGYWMPAALVPAPAGPTRLERWLCRTDEVLRRRLLSVPRMMLPLIELAYLFCYPMVPASLLVVWITGDEADVTRFWVAVLASGYACYATLPWLISRPPRLAPGQRPACRGMSVLNVFVLDRVSHRLNTIPSGHVAVSCSAAAIAWTVSPAAGTAFGVVAAAIAVGAATGRYHYVVDVLLGLLVAGIVVAVTVQLY